MTSLDAPDQAPATLLASWQDGRIKQQILRRLLADRAAASALYADGDYQPLQPTGRNADHLVAFSRSAGGEQLVVGVPRLVSRLTWAGDAPLGSDWGDLILPVPQGAWRNVLTDETVEATSPGIRVAELFTVLPFAVLRAVS